MHPILATRADTGEVLHIRLRKGSANTSRGAGRFLDELIARIARTNATGPRLLRADSGFWNNKTFDKLEAAGWDFSIGVRQNPKIRAAIEAIDETAWTTLEDYPKTSIAQIAETEWATSRRLVIRRVRTLDRQGQLLPTWEHYAFITNRTDDLALVEAEHRQHAQIELAIRDQRPGPRALPPAAFAPTAPGRSSPRSRTTCCAGPSCLAPPTRPSAPPAPCAAAG
ncbi:transposase [Conexibacter sp. W3-3-2]|nr:transposase [Conexibacter sp. W3-3-2]MTD47113.1 transposase [Conexibacter sp. W3-3-2]